LSQFQLWYQAQPRAIRLLLTINVVVYLLWRVVFVHPEVTEFFVYLHLALNPAIPGILFEPWQLLTYSFLHLSGGMGGLLHILFNMMWMVWIGRDYERMYGPGRLFGIYVYGAVGGALLTVLLGALLPGMEMFTAIVHGASGAVLAIMTAVAIHHPQQRIGLMFIGVVRLIHVVIGFIALDILFISGGGTSVSAHLGGVVAGLIAGRVALNGGNPAPWADALFNRSTSSARFSQSSTSPSILQRMEERLAAKKKGASPRPEPKQTAQIYPMDVGRGKRMNETKAEVDRILDKISASGYESLTRKEKEVLLRESESD